MSSSVFVAGKTGRLGTVVADAFLNRGDVLVESEEAQYLVFCHRYRGPKDFNSEMFANVEKVIHWVEGGIKAEGVVIVTSVNSLEPTLTQSLAYNVSKAAQEQLVRYFSNSFPFRCNSVQPNTFTGPDAVVTPQQVADVILFLCSPQSSGINGQSIRVG